MKILVCNSGSSSLKFSLFEADQELLLADGSIDLTILRETRRVIHSDARWESPPRELELATETV
jgi:acetate kinase